MRIFTTLAAVSCLSMLAASCAQTPAGNAPSKIVSASPQPAPTAAPASIAWRKYSPEVFAEAKREHKFVLLDLEAVWCHWCHVMDKDTYSDPKVIALMDRKYIAVKVDQDARPDISARYEDYGWPATIVFNADGGAIVKRQGYIPPRPMASMLEAIIADPSPGPSVRPARTIQYGNASSLAPTIKAELEKKFNANYDAKLGGWGTVHKYLDWDAIQWSMRQARSGDKQAGQQARQTLDASLKLIDPVWGGLYQYSIDGDWDHPHYEKIMQFQAEGLLTYSLAYAQFGDGAYLKAAQAIQRYLADFLTSPDGAFYTSQDADLIDGTFGESYFAMGDAGRRKLGVPRIDKHMYARENGWAIAGLMALYDVSHDAKVLSEAERAAHWVMKHRAIEGGGFHHGAHDPAGPYLGDTLAMGQAFLALYESTSDPRWLHRSQSAADFIDAHFKDANKSPGFITDVPAPGPLDVPQHELDENVAAARFFNLLGHYTGKAQDHASAESAMRYVATPQISESQGPWGAGILLAGAEMAAQPLHVTVVGPKSDSSAKALFDAAVAAPGWYKRVEWWDPSGAALPNMDVEYPKLASPAAFVCTGNSCSSPIKDVNKLAAKLSGR